MKKLILLFAVFSFLSVHAQEIEIKFRTEEINFAAGKFKVAGTLVLPDTGKNFPAVIFCQGSGPTDRKSFIQYSKILRIFIKSGFAFFIDDKPGSNESTGEFSGDSLFIERAMILKKEFELLKLHTKINHTQIGLYGSSQAGYVMPIVINEIKDAAFLIAWSCPAVNSLEQSAYLVKMQVLRGGGTPDEAEKMEKYFLQRRNAGTYREYLEAAKYLDENSVIKELGWGGIMSEDEFSPSDSSSNSYFNPIGLMESVKIPVLAIYGEMDTQVDPIQGAEGYRAALEKAGNKNYKIITIKGVDHNMRVTKTGTLKEQKESYNKEGGAVLSADFQKIISDWIIGLKNIKK